MFVVAMLQKLNFVNPYPVRLEQLKVITNMHQTKDGVIDLIAFIHSSLYSKL